MEKFNVKNGLSVGVDKLSIIDAVGSLSAASVTVNGQYTLPSLDGTSSQVIATDGSGNLSFISASDHGGLTGLGDDDHTQYLKADGTRAGGTISFQSLQGINFTPSAAVVISGDAITSNRTFIELTSQSGTTDDLDTINLGSEHAGEGDIIILYATAGHTITLIHDEVGGYKIRTHDGANVTVTSTKWAILAYHASGYWMVLPGGESGGGGSDISSLSANWESTYTTVSTNSASWGPQTIAFNESTANLTIENGNTISLSALSAAITLPVVDTTAIASDPVDSTKRVRLDAGAVTAGQTRAIQVPNGDCRVRDCIRFEIYDSATQWTEGSSYWLGHIGGSFLIEGIAGVCFDVTGCLGTPQFELFRDGDSVGGPISLGNSMSSGQGRYGELAINDNSGIGNVLTVYINDDGAGSAGNRAYGLVVTVIGYWNIL